ncbi:MAG: CPBP family intramembrane glutamic endopeptidase [Planctomycetota bacterium]|jgi:membrane protease YdiL (CAAX protease family)
MPSGIDHLLVVILAVVVPLYATLVGWPRLKRAVATGKSGARVREYWWTIVLQWLLAGVLVAEWLADHRPLGDLGFGAAGPWRLLACVLVAAAGAAALSVHYVLAVRTRQGRERAQQALEKAAPILPQTRVELGHFAVVSLTAGFCEEVLYRGFLIWYAVQWTGPTFAGWSLAVVISSLVFGIGHLYQGVRGAAQVFLFALLLGALYAVGGSLWVVIALHAYVDLISGVLAFALTRPSGWRGSC